MFEHDLTRACYGHGIQVLELRGDGVDTHYERSDCGITL